MKIKPIIVVSGEPYSVFLEIFFKTLNSKKIKNCKSPILIIASYDLLLKQMCKLKYSFKIKLLDDNFTTLNMLSNKNINLININFNYNKTFDKISTKSNKYIAQCFNLGLKLMKEKKGHVLINGPISKKHFLKKKFPGITEYISSKTGHSGKEVMLIYNKNLAVSPITTHLPLKNIFRKITKKKIIKQVINVRLAFSINPIKSLLKSINEVAIKKPTTTGKNLSGPSITSITKSSLAVLVFFTIL